MAVVQCVWCRSSIPDDEAICRYCLTPQVHDARFKAGDRLRIRNVFKGCRIENVTVIQVARGGSALEVKDDAGLVWGCIHPKDVLGPAVSERERSAV